MFGADWTFHIPIPLALLAKLWAWAMRARPKFGSATQRARGKQPGDSWWHIPITLDTAWYRTAKIEDCEVILIDCKSDVKLKMRWGDMLTTKNPDERQTLRAGEYYLVPIVFRNEEGDDGDAYITNDEFFNEDKVWPIPGDGKKRKFKLSIKCGRSTATSTVSYLIRVPEQRSNGQFSLEVEFEGGGTAPVPIEHASHKTLEGK